MTYHETLEYLFNELPMFQRIGASAYNKDLTKTIQLCTILKNPQYQFKSIHIAGTNGKGSVAHMLSAVLQNEGLKVGLYTSPHLKDFRERIKINGKYISEIEVIDFVEKNKIHFDAIKPSFFEMTVGMAFDYFSKQKVDIAIIETGMGGRLDSTNIISPILSIITNISYDHMQFLGNTLEEIAAEKAGIIKEKIPVIIGETQQGIDNIFLEIAKEKKAKIFFADKNYFIDNVIISIDNTELDVFDKNNMLLYGKLKLDLIGNYQLKNIITIIQTIDILKSLGYIFNTEKITTALSNVKLMTNFLGRWQILNQHPLIITDSAHNEVGIKFAIQQLQSIQHKNLHIVFGMVKDKDVSKIIQLLPKNAIYYFCQPNIPRALDAFILKDIAKDIGIIGKTFNNVNDALQSAKKNAKEKDLIYIGGSMFVVAEVV